MRTITATIESVTPLGNTANGNTMFSVEVLTATDGFPGRTTLRVANDSAIAGKIGNAEFRDTPHVFELTRAGRILRSLGPASF